MRDIQALARQIGRDHALADSLWKTGVYEAQLLAAYVDDPARVTPAQMDRWCREFDNWAVCDTVVLRCSSIERRTHGPRCARGPADARNSRSVRPSRCYGA